MQEMNKASEQGLTFMEMVIDMLEIVFSLCYFFHIFLMIFVAM